MRRTDGYRIIGVNTTDPFGLCPPEDENDGFFCHVLFVGLSGSAIYGSGPTGGAGVILWSSEGPGVYARGGWGFGGDVGASGDAGHSSSLAAFTGNSLGACMSVSVAESSYGGCGSHNSAGWTESVTYGERAGKYAYPVAQHVEASYTRALTAKGMARMVNAEFDRIRAEWRAFEREAVQRMEFPSGGSGN